MINHIKGWSVVMILVLSISNAQACDICGCFAGNTRMGLLNRLNSEFLNFSYGQATFYGLAPLTYDRDVFQEMHLSYQKYFGEEWAVLLEQGYRWNTRFTNENSDGIHGLSNTNVSVYYRWLKKMNENQVWQWRTGASVKLPTGRFVEGIHDQNLPENFNPSDGSWGLGMSTDLTYSRPNYGFIWNVDARYNFDDPTGYQMGMTISSQLTYYYNFQIFKVNWMPYAGVMLEGVGPNRYASGKRVESTGGHGVYASVGLQADLGTFNLGMNYMQPLAFKYGEGQIEAGSRIQFQVTYLFN